MCASHSGERGRVDVLDQINTDNVQSADDKGRAILTVAQLNAYIKQMIDSSTLLSNVWIKGEISNFTNHYKTGHFYFTIKDPDSLIRAVMFKSAASKLKFLPENGMKILARGRVSAFVRDGQYQIYVEAMEPDGVGSLYIAFEQLKRKLEAEGLFAPDRKKPLPKIPTRVGIITSPTGAAVRDMINVTKRRFPYAALTLFPSLVQGADAPAQLIAGVNYFNAQRSVDVIIIGRGGGSIEDLWAFNDEALARVVAASEIPVISAVGHETDFTICDFAADMRAPTPSAAAEIAVPDTAELKRKIGNIVGHMELSLTKRIGASREQLAMLAKSRALTSPKNFIDDKRMALLSLSTSLEAQMKLSLTNKRAQFASLTASLEALNPMSVISRGYSAVFDGEGKLIKSTAQIKCGDRFTFRTTDGSVVGEAIDVIKDTKE